MQLTLSERKCIESGLNSSNSLRTIARQVDRPVSTVSREIRRNAQPDLSVPYGRMKNKCIHRKECSKTGVCNQDCHRKCSTCHLCNTSCPDFCEEKCPVLAAPPYVCNGCAELKKCALSKIVYRASSADKSYRKRLVESRAGFNLTEQELQMTDKLCSPLLLQGQSIYHIAATHPNELICSERTLYRLIHACTLQARSIDMPRSCRMKPRSGKKRSMKIDKRCREGRTLQDFQKFCVQHPENAVVQIDSVVGEIGGKVLLTLHLTSCDFMLAFLREANTSASVIACFDWLRNRLGERFSLMFAILLADNGTEFSNPKEIERDDIHLFYCDPYSPAQKPNVELNHEFIRRILPSGSSFNELTQDDINLMMSHINSYGRSKFGGKSPAELFVSLYGAEALHSLCQELISPEKIILKPSLLRR